MKTIQKRNVALALMLITMLCVVGYASANEIQGDVTVIEKQLTLSNLTAPTPVDPTTTVQMTWTLSYALGGIGSGLLGAADYIDAHIWHSSVTMGAPYGDLHYGIRFDRSTEITILGGPTGWLVSSDPTGQVGQLLDLETTYDFVLNVMFRSISLPGVWYLAVNCPLNDDTKPNVYGEVSFQMNEYSSFVIQESTFSWGDIQHGLVDVPIISPMSGYLTMNIEVNNDFRMRVCGTNPDAGSGHTFPVSNIKVSIVDDPLIAQTLTTALVNLETVVFSVEAATIQVYVWISIPEGTYLATYLTTLTFVLVPI